MKRSKKCGLMLLSMLLALSLGVALEENDTPANKMMPTNVMSSNNIVTSESSPTEAEAADAGSAIIDGVNYSKTAQWVEIMNNETSAQDLTGWMLEVQNKTVYTFPKYMLEVNAKVKVHSGEGKDSNTDLYTMAGILTKADDEVSLLDATGNVISASEEPNEASDSPKDA